MPMTPDPPASWRDIPGWSRNLEWLYRDVVDWADDGACFVEVGVWLGRSACMMGELIRESGKTIALSAVDTFEGTPGNPEHEATVTEHGGSLLSAFWANLDALDVERFVTPIVGRSLDVARAFPDRSIDFLCLDADHSTPALLADLAAWMPKLKPDGIAAGHDLALPTVRAAVAERFGRDYLAWNGCWIHTHNADFRRRPRERQRKAKER